MSDSDCDPDFGPAHRRPLSCLWPRCPSLHLSSGQTCERTNNGLGL